MKYSPAVGRISRWLDAERRRLGVTVKRVHTLAGLNYETVHNLFKGRNVSLETAERALDALITIGGTEPPAVAEFADQQDREDVLAEVSSMSNLDPKKAMCHWILGLGDEEARALQMEFRDWLAEAHLRLRRGNRAPRTSGEGV